MGIRARYWFYNHGKAGVGGLAGVNVHIDMDVLDLEATMNGELWNWDLMVAGGFRYGRARIDDNGGLGAAVTFEGIGGTVALEAAREIGNRGVYIVGNARGSLLFGEVDIAPPPTIADDELGVVLENQLGLGWRREMGRATVDARLVWESQIWLNETVSEITGSHLGFTGPSASLEVRF